MLRFLSALLLLSALTGCAADPPAAMPAPVPPAGGNASLIRNPIADGPLDSSRIAALEFADPEYAFGEVSAGTVVRHAFRFINTGGVPLLITDARSTCGCTVPSYPEQPVAPGAEGVIRVEFNTGGKRGRQRKPVSITANTYPATTTIYLDGTVRNDPNN